MITFFTNYFVGFSSIYATIYFPSIHNIPDVNDYDILFEPIVTQLSLGNIKEIFMQNAAEQLGVNSI